MSIRKFALVILDDFDNELNRYALDYADTPTNLGFELEFTTLESRLTTYFTSARERKLPTTLNINFLPPNAYQKANLFKQFVQKYVNNKMLFEYNDTFQTKYWEGKLQKFGQEELTDWGGLVCPIVFMPGTPKFLRQQNTIIIQPSETGKSYPYSYPYSYGKGFIQQNTIDNTYFDELPLRMTIYGPTTNPQITLTEVITTGSGEDLHDYSTVRFSGLSLAEGEHLIVDSINSKVLLYRNGSYTSAYDYVDKASNLDTFLYVKGGATSKVIASFTSGGSGSLVASYRQYLL